jgi:diadenylate cyclase
MRELIFGFRWQDGLDIFLLAIVIYWGINLIRGTRAVPMLIGLGMVYGIYFLSKSFEIYTLNVILNYVLDWSLVLVLIVFQNDIRRALTQVGTGPLFTQRERIAHRAAERGRAERVH